MDIMFEYSYKLTHIKMSDQKNKPETESDLRVLLAEMREKRLKQYDDLKAEPQSETRDNSMADVVMRGKRIRSALDFLDGK